MGRKGQNPLKWINDNENAKDITVITIVHIPELSGFWENSLDSLKMCLESLVKNTEEPFDLMVWDNGSCDKVKQFLMQSHNNGTIHSLYFSKYNLRKIGALNHLFNLAPGKYISYADSDVFFKEKWLTESLKVLNTFPEAGMVSCIPTIDKTEEFYESTFEGIQKAKDITIDKGSNLIPKRYVEAHRLSIGKTEFDYFEPIQNRQDIKISRGDTSAFVCAQDFQFTTKRDVIRKILPLDINSDDLFYDPIYSPVFESKINSLGYWRISTAQYLIHHIGNNLDNLDKELKLIDEIHDKSQNIKVSTIQKPHGNFFIRLVQHPISRKILKSIYSKIYKLLYEI